MHMHAHYAGACTLCTCMHTLHMHAHLQVACAQMLLHALGAGNASQFAANALKAAIWTQPGIAALVCLGRGDKGGAAQALAECTSAEQVRLAATFAVKWRSLV